MSFVEDAQLYLPFDNGSQFPLSPSGSLLDFVTGNLLTTNNAPSYAPGVFNQGLNLANNFSGTEIGIMDGYVDTFTIGFWLNPQNPGMTTTAEPLKMPLFSKSGFTPNTTQYVIWEETQSDGTNIMKVMLNYYDTYQTSIYTSNPYTTGVFHHFWITFSYGTFNMYIDMSLDSGSMSGEIPYYLTYTSSSFGINVGVLDSSTYTAIDGIALNNGTIDDLVIFNTARNDLTDIYRAMIYGVPSVIDTTLNTGYEVDQAVIFDDTTTIEITAMFGNRGNVYIGRSDGKILQGIRTLWESRIDFSDSNEINLTSIITRSATDNFTIQNGAINITNAIVRV